MGARVQAERISYGARIEDGFGRVAITTPAAWDEMESSLFGDGKERPTAATRKIKLLPGEPAHAVAVRLFRKAVERRATQQAFVFRDKTQGLANVNPHLVYRIIGALERSGLAGLQKWLPELKPAGQVQLDKVRLDGKTLQEWLLAACSEAGQKRQFEILCDPVVQTWSAAFGDGVNPLAEDPAARTKITELFVLSYLGAVAGNSRRERRENQ
jgi:hypothetical protein